MNVDQRHPSAFGRRISMCRLAVRMGLLGACCSLASLVSAVPLATLSPLSSLILSNTGNASPAPISSFAGINPANSTPPDSHGAVSATHVVTQINGQSIVQDRSGTILANVSLTTFWSSLGVTDVFDPKVIYDPHSNRFMAMACAQRRSSSSGMLFGVTATSDPTGTWHLWLLDADSANVNWVDFPNIGVTSNWITLTGNLFSNSADAFGGANIWVLNKSTVLDGGAFTSQLMTVTNAGGTLVPALTYDATETTQYLVRVGASNLFGSGRLQVYSLTGTIGTLTFTAIPFASIGTAWSISIPNAKQLGSTATIETNDDRLMNAVIRNGRLWTTHTVAFDTTTRDHSAVKWWEITPSNGTVIQTGLIEDVRADGTFDNAAGNYYYYPTISVNANNEALIGFSGSGALEYVSAYYAFRAPTYATGQFDVPFKYKAGLGVFSGPRWGDYSATVVDPTDDATFWTIQEFASGSNKGGNWWGKIGKSASDTTAPRLTGATALTSTTVRLTFDEAMQDSTALITPSFYTFTGGLTATSVTRLNATQVTVTVNEMIGGTSYTATVSTAGPADLAGNRLTSGGNTAAFTGLGGAPTAVISLDDPTPTNLNTVNFSVDFSESVGTSFTSADVSVTGSLSTSSSAAVSGGPIQFTVSVTPSNPSAEGTLGISVGTGITDLVGNTFGGGTSPQAYTLDNTAPAIGVTALTTTDSTPALSGTINDNSATISVVVGSQTRTATNNGNGTWTLANNSLTALADNVYSVTATATDAAGNSGTDGTTNELTVDATAPVVTVNSRVTNDTTPQLTGGVNEATATVTVVVGGQTRTATNNGNGTWTLPDGSLTALADGVYNVAATATDSVGNMGSDSTSNELTVDATAPVLTINTLITKDTTPALSGTTSDLSAAVSVTVSGQTRTATNNGNGTWTLADNSLTVLAVGVYNVSVTSTDAAGNAGTDSSANELTIDTTAPTVTINTLSTNDTTPPLTGTVNDQSATISVVVGGQTRTATNNGNGTWTLANGSLTALAQGTYSVVVTATDQAGNAATDGTTNELIIDTVAPTIAVATRVTNDTTPPLNGTVNDGTATISVTVNGQTRTATNNGATWTLADGSLTALPAGTYNVVATATDAAGNVGTESTTGELTIDIAAPTISVNALNTTDSTPALSGTVNETTASIRITVGSQTNLTATNNGNGTWTLADNTLTALADGTYDVVATATDAAGNAGADGTTNELVVDSTAPVVTVNALVTKDTSPPLSGTVNDTTATISVVVGGQTRSGTNNGNGTWSLADNLISPVLPAGTYNVAVTATDTTGNAGTDSTASELLVDTAAPTITVTPRTTNDTTPALSGTVNDPTATISVVVGGQTRTATNNGNGTWTLADGSLTALAAGTYSVAATATDAAGNTGADGTLSELVIDVTAPTISVATLVTKDSTPALSGTVNDPAATIAVTVSGQTRTATNNGNGTWTLADNTLTALGNGVFSVVATATDAAENVGTDGTSNELTVDTIVPTITVNTLATTDTTPPLSGTVSETGATISITVGGQTRTATNNGNGTWTLADNSLTALANGVFNVAATATDAAGNAGADGTTNELTVDNTPPVVTVNTLNTNDQTPQLTGTVNETGATIRVSVGGQLNLVAVNNGNGTWTLADNTINPALVAGAYNVAVTATDALGNAGTDATTNELVIDLTAPTVTVTVLTTNDNRPPLSGTVSETGATITVAVGGQTNLAAVNNGNGTWTLADNTINPALAEGTYNVSVTATDASGNAGADATNNELRVDATAPVVTVATLVTNDNRPALGGTVNDTTASIRVDVGGQTNLVAVNNGNGTWTLADNTISPALANGTYNVVVRATDTASNVGADASISELTIDTTAPTVTVNTLSTNDNTPPLTGTVSETGASISVTVSGQTKAAVNNGNGTWTLANNSLAALPDSQYNVSVTATDAAGNAGTDATTNELRVDTTAPTVTVNTLTTNDTTPALSGTVNDATATISVTVGGQTRTATNNGATWTLANNTISPALAAGTYDVAVTATDAVGNGGTDATISELVIDATAPTITVTARTTNDTTPALSGTVNDGVAAISITVNGSTYPAVNNGATWTLTNDTITPALTAGTFSVTATATDVAGNTGTDGSINELVIDLTAPTIAVTPRTTNDTTPSLSGTTNDNSAVITVFVGGQTRTATNNGNGTWTLADNAITPALAAGAYDVLATATDTAGNAGVDGTSGELTIDTTAPTVTIATLLTNDNRPPLSGTVNDTTATISVSVNALTFPGTNNGDGTWSLANDTITPALADNTYPVTVTATDAAGNAGVDGTTNELRVDTVAPTISVNTLVTADSTPALTGSVNDTAAVVTVVVSGQTRTATNNGNGTWTLANNSLTALPDGTYSVAATARDSANNARTDSTANELRIDTTGPVVTVTSLATRDNRPPLSGTINDTTATVSVVVDGQTRAATNNGNGTWTLANDAITPALADNIYDVAVTATDSVSNTGTDSSTGELRIDTTLVVTVTTLTTSDNTPALNGTVDDATATISVLVNGSTYTGTNNGNGTWTLADNTITPALPDATYSVTVTASDSLGNVATDGTTSELVINGSVPTVTVSALATSDSRPALSGTVSTPAATVRVDVGGQLNLVAVNNGNGTWTLPNDTINPALADGTYDVQVRATTSGTGTDSTANELVIDTAAPVVTVDSRRTNDQRPALSGTVNDPSAVIRLTVSVHTNLVVTNNGDGTWTLADNVIPANLAAGIFNVSVTATDAAGNAGTDGSLNELAIDLTAPTITVTTLLTNDNTPAISGTVNDTAATISVTVNGQTRSAVNGGAGTWTLADNSLSPLVDGTYSVAASATDVAGNTATDGTASELTVDTTAPTVGVNTLTTGDSTPALSGTVGDTGATISVVVGGQTRAATNNGNGTWTLADGTINPALADGTYAVTVTATDAAGNAGVDGTTNELRVDITAPVVTVNNKSTNDRRPPLSGTVNDNTATIRVTVGAQSNLVAVNNGNGTWTLPDNTILTNLTDGTYNVVVTATDSVGNAATDASISELVIDATAPTITVTALTTNDNRPSLSGTTNDTTATINVLVGGQTRAATNNGNGTWTLADNLISPALADGTYEVVARATDTLNNSRNDSSANELRIDTVVPVVTVNTLTTNDDRPALTGTVNDTAAVVRVSVGGQSNLAATNNGNGTWSLADNTISPALVSNTYNVAVTATDGAGNAGVDGTTNELVVDTIAPTITVTTLTTSDTTPSLSGTVNDNGATIRVTVGAQSNLLATNNGNGTWTLADNTLTPLGGGVFSVVATATDTAGNTGTDGSINELNIDTSAPTVSVDTLATVDNTPSLTGTVNDNGATISILVSGQTRAATNNGDGTWTLADNLLTTLADGTYDVQATATDIQGNAGTDNTTGELRIDTVAPVVTVNALTTADNRPQLTGTVNDITATVSINVNALNFAATNNGNGTWTLADNAITPALADNTYNVTVTATDTLGNTSTDGTTNELRVLTAAPVITITTITTNDTTPALSGTVNDTSASVSIQVNSLTFPATNNGNGTWTLANNAIAPALAEGVYSVIARATNAAGVSGQDATNNELTIDVTAPVVAITTRFTTDTRPALSGTVNTANAAIRVDVGGQTNRLATNNGNGTWTLADDVINPALAQGSYNVVVRATDTAGNVGTDSTTNELHVDTTAPVVTVASQSTNDNTPGLSGTVSDNIAASTVAVQVTVNGQVRTAVVTAGTWIVTNGSLTTIPDGVYDVVVAATDQAGNVGADATNNELRIDTAAPTVTVTGLNTNDPTPSLTGTVNDPTATIRVSVGGQTNVTAVNNGAGTWTLPDNTLASLSDGTYNVSVSASDAVGNSGSDATTDELRVDATAPVITVNSSLTTDSTPALSGTVNDAAAVISITVNGVTYPATNNGDGTWALADGTIAPALTSNTYNVAASAEDGLGNTGTDATTDELVVDLVSPVVTVSPLLTNDPHPPLTGTVDDNTATITVTVGGQTDVPATNNGDGTWMLSDGSLTALPDGIYDVVVRATDAAGNTGVDGTTNELTINSQAPTVTVSALLTNDGTPALSGTVDDPGATVTVSVGSQTGLVATNGGAGTWTLADNTLTTLADGTYNVVVTAVDLQGNSATDTTIDELRIDATAPTVSVTPLLTKDNRPALSGAVDDPAATVRVAVNGESGLVAVNNGDGTWSLPDDTIAGALPDNGTGYDVVATATDTLGNGATDATSAELQIDTVAPAVGINPIATNEASPSLTGTTDDNSASIRVTVNGETVNATNNSNGTWTLAGGVLTALSSGLYDIDASATDPATNSGTATLVSGLSVDVTAPVISVNTLVTTDTTPPLSGTVDDTAAVVLVTVAGQTQNATNNGNGTWTLADDILTTLVDGLYDVTATATDSLGNIGTESSNNELRIDTSGPKVTINRLVTNDTTPRLTGTVDEPGVAVNVTVDGNTYAATNNGDGTWTLADDTITPALSAGSHEIVAVASDGLGNAGADATTLELTIDLTTPVVTVNTSLTSLASPNLTGTVDDIFSTVTVTVGGQTRTATNIGNGTWALVAGRLDPLVSGVYDVVVEARDGAGNVATDATVNELTVDLGVPAITVDELATNDSTPPLTGTVDDATATVTITVAGQSVVATNNGDGTWSIADGALAPLADGSYNVLATAEDAAGNLGTDPTLADDLFIVTAPPEVSVISLTTADTTPQLNGHINQTSSTITVTVDGQTHAATNNGDGTWTLADNTLTALAEGTYNVEVQAVDLLGNAGTDTTTNELTINLSAALITVDRLTTRDKTPALSGTVSVPGIGIFITIGNQTHSAINNDDGTWTLPDDTLSSLEEGVYDVAAEALGGATSTDTTINELTVDTLGPSVVISGPSIGATQSGPVSFNIHYGADAQVGLLPSDVTTFSLLDANVTVLKGAPIASHNKVFPISTGTATGVITLSGTGNQVRTVTVSDITGNGYLGIALVGGSAVDSSGNPADGAIAVDLVNVDNTAPKLLSGGVANQGILVLAFDEAMSDTALEPTNYTITGPGQGTLASNPDLVVRTAPDRYRLIWSTGAAVDGEEIVVTALNVTDAVTNLIGANNSVSVLVEGLGVAPVLTDFQVTGALSATVRFSEPVAVGATERNSYTLSGSGRGTLAAQPATVTPVTDVVEPEGQPEIVVPPNTYQLTWNGGEMVDLGDLTITVAGIEDNSGDTVGTPNSLTDTGAGIGTAPTVTLADVVTGLSVETVFSEPMGADALTAANYALSGAGQGTLATTPDSVSQVSPGRYRLVWTAGEMVNGRDVTITASGVTDEAGNTLGTPNSATDLKAGRDGLITAKMVSRRGATLYEDGEGDVASGAGALLLSGTTADGDLRRSLLHFDVAGGIPAGSTVTEAQLLLTSPGTPGDGTAQDIGLYPVTSDWTQGDSDAVATVLDGAPALDGDATWLHTSFDNEFWTSPGGDFLAGASATASVAGAGIHAWSSPAILTDAQAWLDNPSQNFGWILVGPEGAPGTLKAFYSDDHPIRAERPVLEVVYSLNGGPGGPTLSTIGDQEATEGEAIALEMSAVDSGGNPLVLSASLTTLPEGSDAQFTDNGDGTATFAWTPTFVDSGSYVVTFIATQSGVSSPLSISESIAINVAELNQAPTLADPGVLDATEGQLFQFTASLTDNDAGDTHAYSLAASQGDAAIDPSTGVLTWTPGYSDAGDYTIGIVAIDNGAPALSIQLPLQVRVADANGAPILSPIGNQVVVEAEDLAFTAVAADPDQADTLTFSMEGGPAGSTLDGVTGQFRWTPNIISAGDYDVSIVVTDDGTPPQSDRETITISVVDDNRNPSDIALSPASVEENLPAGTVVGRLSTVDPDVGDAHVYSLVAGAGDTDNGVFTIVDNEVRTGVALNFEARSAYSIRVQSADGKDGEFAKAVAISVVNANDLPQSITLSNNLVVENVAIQSTVGVFSTEDQDLAGTHTYSLVAGDGDTSNSLFAIAGTALVTNGIIDFERQATHSVRVRSTDPAGASIEAVFPIVVENTNDSPSGFNLTGGVLEENQATGALVGTFITLDDDFSDDHVYALVAGDGATNNNQFRIEGDELRTAVVLDYEKGRMLSIRVRVTDNQSLNIESVFAVEVTDTNDAPSELVVNPTGILDKVPADTAVARLFTTDQDLNDTHTYSLVAGEGSEDNGIFKILGASLATAQFLEFDSSARFNVRLRTTDAGGASLERAVVLTNDDTDGDGLSDIWERTNFGNLNNGADGDSDGDGLSNRDEFSAGTNPATADTDGDGANDGLEVSLGTNPVNNLDAPAVLRVSPGSLSIGRDAGQLTLTIRNTGIASLNWQAEVVDGDFVVIDGGASGVNTGVVSLSVEANSGATGRSGMIRITAPNAAGSPLDIPLTQDACSVPGAADDVLATNGTLPGQVRISWDRVPGADRYQVYRGLGTDPADAELLATVTGTAFTDNTAEVLDGGGDTGSGCNLSGSSTDSGCFVPTNPGAGADAYLYWIRAISVCGTGTFSTPNDGYPGAGEPPARELFEPVLPTLETENRTLTARADSTLAIRLRRDTAIDPGSVEGLVEFAGGSSTEVEWMAIDTAGLRDGWALFTPAEGQFVAGDTVNFTVSASTLAGETIGPLSYSFTIETEDFFLERLGALPDSIFQPEYTDFDSTGIDLSQEGNDNVSVYELASPPASLAGGSGSAYAIVPDEAYRLNQRVWIPLADGVSAADVAVYYYFVDKSGTQTGWRPASDIKGWFVEDSLLELELDGVRYVGFVARHGALVQLGAAAGKSEEVTGASALPLGAIFGPRSGDGIILLGVLVLFAVAWPRRMRRGNLEDR